MARRRTSSALMIDTRRQASPGGSVSHENSKLLGGLAIDSALNATRPEQPGFSQARGARCG